MVILGLTGPIGHGKSTFAKALINIEPNALHFESGLVVSEVANALQESLTDIPDAYNVTSLNNWLHALPSIINNILHVECTFADIELHQDIIEQHPIEYQKLIMHVENMQRNPELAKTEITIDNKENFRPLLQWLGGYLVQKVDPGIWYNEIVRRIHDASKAGANLCVVGGIRYPNDAAVLKATGAVIVELARPGHLQSDSLDPTERERQNVKPDCRILNNGSLADLTDFAPQFLEALKNKRLEASYSTTHL